MNRHIILTLDSPPSWSKTAIDQGQYPEQAVKLASCVRSAFLLSHNIRKNTTMTLVPRQADYEITLNGGVLRYLDPSERGILLLLRRAFFPSSSYKKHRLTPGFSREPQHQWKQTLLTPKSTLWIVDSTPQLEKPHSKNNNILLIDLDQIEVSQKNLPKHENLKRFGLQFAFTRPSFAILAFHHYLDRE